VRVRALKQRLAGTAGGHKAADQGLPPRIIYVDEKMSGFSPWTCKVPMKVF
jgi:hypothetical protein